MKSIRLFGVMMLLAFTTIAGAQDVSEDLDGKYATELLKPGTVVPDFTLKSLSGKVMNFKNDIPDGYVVLDFWASWCGDCRKDMPAMRELANKYLFGGVDFVGISFDTDSVKWKNCVQDIYKLPGFHFSELKKWKETQFSKDYHISWLPTMYLINPDRTVNLATVEVSKLAKRLAELKDSGQLEKYRLKMPEYTGGIEALVRFLKQNLKYPNVCEKAGVEAKVFVRFSIDKDGNISDARINGYKQISVPSYKTNLTAGQRTKIEQQCCQLLEQEALRVVKIMPRWQPGQRAGKNVKVQYALPINFKFH